MYLLYYTCELGIAMHDGSKKEGKEEGEKKNKEGEKKNKEEDKKIKRGGRKPPGFLYGGFVY